MMNANETSIEATVSKLTQHYLSLWWQGDAGFPLLPSGGDRSEKRAREDLLADLLNQTLADLDSLTRAPEQRLAVKQRLTQNARRAGTQALGFTDQQMDSIEQIGLSQSVTDFVRQARRFDPTLPQEDIYQASRNALSMNLLQYLSGRPVRATPSILAYSLLYPYSDNFLDDAAVPLAQKQAFNQRFARRLVGERLEPAGDHESKVFALVAMVEEEFERARFPLIYESLLAIHAAQNRSLALQRGRVSPYEVDVLTITFEKGGAAVLAAAHLAAGEVTPELAHFAFGYGIFTQLMDDQEDVLADRESGLMTVFSQTLEGWPLDAITNRAFRLSGQVLRQIENFDPPGAADLQAVLIKGVALLMTDTALRIGHYYSYPYRRQLEEILPVRFSFLEQQRRKLKRRHVSAQSLFDSLLRLEDPAGS